MFTRKSKLDDLPTVRYEDMFVEKHDRRRSDAEQERAQQQRDQRARDTGWRRR